MSEKSETSELKDLAGKYSKKWGVSEEEAEAKIKKFLVKKPVDRSKVTPSMDNLFPEPVGPLSEKIQDINQAAISSAFTRKSLRELGQPPKEMEDLKGRMETIENLVNTTMEFVNTTMKEMQSTLEVKQEDEKREQLIEELESRVINPLKEELKVVKEQLKESPGAPPEESIITIKEKLDKAEEDAKAVLKGLGYPVPESKGELSVVHVPKKDEDLVEELKQRGYRVEFDMIPREQAAKMAEEAKRGAQEDVLEDRRIQAVENIFRDALNRIFDMFTEPLQRWMESSMTSVERGPEESRPQESSASRES